MAPDTAEQIPSISLGVSAVSQEFTSEKSRQSRSAQKPPIPVNAKGVPPSLGSMKKNRRRMKPGAPSATVVRGFETPTASAGEESDISACGTPRLGPTLGNGQGTSAGGSPAIRPSEMSRVMSGLKLQLDALELERSASQSSLGSARSERADSDGDDAETGTYEIPLTGDFASAETQRKRLFRPVEGGLRTDSPHRKMAASDFEPLKCLGKGAYGTVLLVKQHSTGRLFAQKQLKKASLVVQNRLVEQTKTERAILENVNRHPFVVKLYYAFQDQKKLYLILEYAQGGELFHHLAMERMFSEEVAAFYMAEMVLALEHLHHNLGVVYRDLKPENCLLDADGHLLLTDFGLSKVAVDDPSSNGSESKCNSILGTVDYMAPEIVRGQPYDAAVDWWSLGALGFDLLTGSPPFSANNHAKIQQKILHAKLSIPYYLSPDAKDFLTRLLRKEPRKRLGGNMPKDMSTIKAHRFFRRIDWKAMQKRELVAPIQPIITDPSAAENFAQEFTELAMSPVETRSGHKADLAAGIDVPSNVTSAGAASVDGSFGGFSFVASRSLIEAGEFI